MNITEKEFLHQVCDHVLEVIRDDGVHRHIRLQAPGTMCEHFDLITWPGYLCYTGDMGTYVFRRLHDMFEFFRTDRRSSYLQVKGLTLGVNFQYWAEKVEAGEKSSSGNGIKEFSIEIAHESVRDYVKTHTDHLEPNEDDDEAEKEILADRLASLTTELQDEIYNTSDKYEFVQAVRDFSHDGFEFNDFWEYTTDDWTHRFVWCCYALAWRIQKYDDSKNIEGVSA
jgi:hypothetical protein